MSDPVISYVTTHLFGMLDLLLTAIVGGMARVIARGITAEFRIKLDNLQSDQTDQNVKFDEHTKALAAHSAALEALVATAKPATERMSNLIQDHMSVKDQVALLRERIARLDAITQIQHAQPTLPVDIHKPEG